MGSVDTGSLRAAPQWGSRTILVWGAAAGGFAAADNLAHLGAQVIWAGGGELPKSQPGELLATLGVHVVVAEQLELARLPQIDLVVFTTDSATPTLPVDQLARAGTPIWAEAELAWQLQSTPSLPKWLLIAGARPTQVTSRLLETAIGTSGVSVVIGGEGGIPLVEAVMHPQPPQVLIAVLEPTQLPYVHSLRPHSGALLAPAATVSPHSPHNSQGKTWDPEPHWGRVFTHVSHSCVYDVADPASEDLVRAADVVEGARAIGVSLQVPEVGMVGVVDDVVVDRAFIDQRFTSAAELCTLTELGAPDSVLLSDVLAAVALARSTGVELALMRQLLLQLG